MSSDFYDFLSKLYLFSLSKSATLIPRSHFRWFAHPPLNTNSVIKRRMWSESLEANALYVRRSSSSLNTSKNPTNSPPKRLPTSTNWSRKPSMKFSSTSECLQFIFPSLNERRKNISSIRLTTNQRISRKCLRKAEATKPKRATESW